MSEGKMEFDSAGHIQRFEGTYDPCSPYAKPHLMPRSYCPRYKVYVRWDPVRERVTVTFNPRLSPVNAYAHARHLFPRLEHHW